MYFLLHLTLLLKEIQSDSGHPNDIIKQIKILVEDYKITNIKIPDEMFVLNPKQVTGI